MNNFRDPPPAGTRVLIRTDASPDIGMGHLNRCLSLASALKGQGASVTFACAGSVRAIELAVRDQAFSLVTLESDRMRVAAGAYPESVQVSDAEATALAIGKGPFEWAIVDHYGLSADWERGIRAACRRVAAIDDLADREHDCDLLLDQNLRSDGGEAYDALLPPGCERLLGPRYALVDDTFSAARAVSQGQARDGLLLSFGGSDPRALTMPVLRALHEAAGGEYRIDVVVGALNRDAAAIAESVAALPRITIHQATRDMAGLMARARLFIGAGGSTSWERCCLGLPGVVVSTAPNQEEACRALHDAGSHVYLGRSSEVRPEAMARAAMALLAAPAWWQRLADASSSIVDGLGAQRVAARLCAGELRLRQARPEDEGRILAWRNDPAVRKHSGTADEISPGEHARWFSRMLSAPDCDLLIGEDALGPCGVLRYDVVADAATVSIYVAPARLGTGIGSALLAAGERWLSACRPAVRVINARVHSSNRASVRLFAGAGYLAHDKTYVKRLVRRSIQ